MFQIDSKLLAFKNEVQERDLSIMTDRGCDINDNMIWDFWSWGG